MGNTTTTTSKKGFKTEGHVLGSAPVSSSQPSNTTNKSKNAPSKTPSTTTTTTTTKTTTASSAFANLLPKSKPKAPPLTSEQIEERRRRLAQAAHARDKAWDDRLNKQRAKRDEERMANNVNNTAKLELLGSTKQPDLGPLDPEIARRQKEAADRLKQSGFNPYEATVASSTVARSAIIMDRGEGGDLASTTVSASAAGNTTNSAKTSSSSSASRADRMAAVEEESRMMQQANEARVALLKAMDGSDAEALRRAITGAERFDLVDEVASARELLQVLEENNEAREGEEEEVMGGEEEDEELAVLGDIIASLKRDPEAEETLPVLRKLLGNLAEHPEEVRYRRIRTGNKTISEKIVKACGGKAVLVLESVGFRREVEAEEAVYAVPDPATLPPDVVEGARRRCEHALKMLI